MAEIINNSGKKQSHFKRLIKKSTKVDLTPMVDLGFLLITFFVFTTSMTEPKSMKIILPKDGESTKVQSSKTLTVIPIGENLVNYYEGELTGNEPFKQTTNSPEGIRKIILEKKQKIKTQFGTDDLILIIKPSNESNYKNFVDILDEITIDEVKIYFIDKLSAEEKNLLAKN